MADPIHAATEQPRSFGLLTTNELAAELKCSRRHIERLAASRAIPKIRVSSRCVRYRREAVLAALLSRETVAITAYGR